MLPSVELVPERAGYVVGKRSVGAALRRNFLGNAPAWYKLLILSFLVINPILFAIDGFVAGWVLLVEFIFTLIMALKCYPLQPGGLLALEAIAIGMATPEMVLHEAEHNFPVILLLIFMVAGIYFLREMLLLVFTKILVGIRSKTLLSLTFLLAAAFLSAFLDALTVMAVVITVASGFFAVYHRVASGKTLDLDHDPSTDDDVIELHRSDLEQFRAFLRSLMMHGAIGTALGGAMTLVGEPQNLLIGAVMGWDFQDFFGAMRHISVPVLLVGIATCVVLERFRVAGYGTRMSRKVRRVLEDFDRQESAKRTPQQAATLATQGVVAALLVLGLGLSVAEPGMVGLMVIVLATALTGITEEHRIGHAFTEALPFAALLVVFFAIVAVISSQQLFAPVIEFVMSFEGKAQIAWLYVANGLLSAISDNVFVATVYITEIQRIYEAGGISREQFDALAVATNMGTNIPSVATPNGQAAFLFLLTSAVAPLIRLSYGRMMLMSLPYAIIMAITGFMALWLA